MNTKLLTAALATSIAFAGIALAGNHKGMHDNPMVGGAAMLPTKDIIDNAVNSKDHTTLVAAVQAAGLVDTLKSKGPFTVFAPTNAAFAKLPAGTLDSLLKPENQAKLQAILKYHVVSGDVKAADVVKLKSAPTLQGGSVAISVMGMTVKVNDATVTATDIAASNGTIHVIDTVLLPPAG